MSYPLDQPVRLTFTTTNAAGVLTDPTNVTLYLRDPAGTETTLTLAGAQVVKDSTGTFHYDVTPTLAGHYSAHWKATGTVATAQDQGFDVDPRYGAWISAQDVIDDLNMSASTSELQGVVDAACSILENLPGYTVADHVKQTTVTEWHDAASQIILGRYPVASVTSVVGWSGTTSQTFSEAAWDSGLSPDYGYTVESDKGFLYLTSGGYESTWSGRVKVVYTAGVATVPSDLRLAALLLVEHLWETQRGGQGSGLPSGLELEETGSDFGSSFLLPRRVEEALAGYRRAPAVA